MAGRKGIFTFQPLTNPIVIQPIILNTETNNKDMFIPSSCWSWVGSLATLAVRVPELLSSASKKGIGFANMLSKYSCR